jgi:hypothetical protein
LEKPHWLSIVAVVLAGAGAFLLSTGGCFEVRAGAIELFGALFGRFMSLCLANMHQIRKFSFSVVQLLCAQF